MNYGSNGFSFLKNEDAFALVTSMLFLVILTLIGIAATHTSTIEMLIAGGEKNRQKAFYAAEAGIEHCTNLLIAQFRKNFAINPSADWDFALSDVEPGVEKFDFIKDTDDKESLVWIKDKAIGTACTYTVMVRDNDNDTDPDLFLDDDNFICMTSIATTTDGSTVGIEILLEGTLAPGTATGYTAQAGAGAGKSYKADDTDSITDFTIQTAITP